MSQNRLINAVQRRAEIYERRTGDLLPMNALAKTTWVLGAVASAETYISTGGSDATKFFVGLGCTVVGITVDRRTGGLRGYSEEALTLETSEDY